MMTVVLTVLAVTPVQLVVLDVREMGLEKGGEKGQGALVVEELARDFPAEAFKVTTAVELSTLLGLERQRQLLSCGEGDSCTAELASALGAEVVAQTTLAKVDGVLRCNVVFMSGRDGASLDRVSAEAPQLAGLLAQLREQTESAAGRILGKLRPGVSLSAGRRGVRQYAWAPALAGAALAGTGAALFAVTADTWRTLNSRDGRVTDPIALAESGRATQNAAWILTSVGAAALLTSAGMLAFGASTPPKVIVAPVASGGGGGLVLTGVLP